MAKPPNRGSGTPTLAVNSTGRSRSVRSNPAWRLSFRSRQRHSRSRPVADYSFVDRPSHPATCKPDWWLRGGIQLARRCTRPVRTRVIGRRQLLARRLIEDVTLDVDLLQHCVSVSGGSFRPMLGMFEQIERIAKAAGVRSLGLTKWQRLTGFAALPEGAEPPRRPNAKQTAKIAAAG